MKEFADFLGGQPPFDALDPDDLARLAAQVEVEYFAAGAVVVREDEQLDHLWVVRTGALEVVDRGRVVDLLGPGDTFGHVSLVSRLPAGVRVRAHEESLCLRVADPRAYLTQPQRLRFADLTPVSRPERLVADGALSGASRPLTRVMRPVVWCRADDRIRDVAGLIGAAEQSCALVRTEGGLGIVTDHDFRRRVAGGELTPDAPVGELATVPALTVPDDATQAAGFLLMVEHGVHHLVVVDQAAAPVGVVRVVDLAQAGLRDPLLVRSAIETAATIDALADAARALPATLVELHDNGVPAAHVGAIHAALVDAVLRRILTLRPPVLGELSHSWVLLGSLARREPLPRSDVDTALVWADPEGSAPDPADAVRAEAARVLDDLRRCGLSPCPNGANADNPLFSRSRAAWAAAARGWMADPSGTGALLLSAMVADSRPLTDVALGRHLTDAIRSHTRTSQFLRALLDEALGWRPPLGFVRGFVVHHSGEHRGQLDLKRGGLAPVVALGRWIAIATGDARGTTPERLRRGAAAGLLTPDEEHMLVGGFGNVYALLLDHEVESIRAGGQPDTFVDPHRLDPLARRHLRETFRAIAHVQARVDQDWIRRLPG